MANTYSQSHAALIQLVEYFREYGTPHESHGMEPCESILEIPSGDGFEWSMETTDHFGGELHSIRDYRWFRGSEEVEAHEVYEALFQI